MAPPLLPTTMAPAIAVPKAAAPAQSNLEKKLDDLMEQLKRQAQVATTPAPRFPVQQPYYPIPMPVPYPYVTVPATTPTPTGATPMTPAAATTLTPVSAPSKPDGIAAQALQELYQGQAAGSAARQTDAISAAATYSGTEVEQPGEPVPSTEFDPHQPLTYASLKRKEQEAWERAHRTAHVRAWEGAESAVQAQEFDPHNSPPSDAPMAGREQLEAWGRAQSAARALMASGPARSRSLDPNESADPNESRDHHEKTGQPAVQFAWDQSGGEAGEATLFPHMLTQLGQKLGRAKKSSVRLGHK